MRRVVDAQPDVPDVRDIIYAPTLMPLRQTLVPFEKPAPGREKWWNDGRIRDQGRNRSCVGHALAAVIDHMRADALIATGEGHVDRTLARPWTSALMLYWLARYHDEWAGEDYSGSSIRGALKGFFYNGVASEQRVAEEHRETRHVPPAPAGNNSDVSWYMTKRLLQEARTLQLGAYYRVRPRLADMHAALGETGAVICSAAIHDGWYQVGQGRPTIAFDPAQNLSPEARPTLHAFVVVGYDGDAFWVQNSWGPNWARKGLARWTYEDWAANVVDAWVLRLAILPQTTEDCGTRRLARIAAYGSRIQRSETHFLGRVPTDSSGPSRLDVLGHLVPFQDGILDRFGPYNVNRQTLQETFELISCRYADGVAGNGKVFADGNAHVPPGERKYQHVLIYFLGGWPNEDRLAADVADAIPGFLENHIYPFFVSWDTPIFRELGLIVERATAEVASYATQTNNRRRDARDRAVEGRIAPAASRLLRALRCSARRIFVRDQPEPDLPFKTAEQGYGAYALSRLFEAMAAGYRDGSLSYHFAAHGFGAQVLVECLAQQGQLSNFAHFSSCTLISPLVASHRLGHRGDLTNSLFDCLMLRGEKPNRRSPLASLDIERLRLVVLGEEALKADRFIDNYGCSWPALWSSVLAHDQFISDRFDKTDEFIRESGGQLGGHPRLRLLALHDEALNFTDKSRRAGLDVECQFVGSRSEIEHSSLHHELGFHPDVLNQLVNEILPKKVGATFAPAGRKIDLHKK